jgi:hypothetical protein
MQTPGMGAGGSVNMAPIGMGGMAGSMGQQGGMPPIGMAGGPGGAAQSFMNSMGGAPSMPGMGVANPQINYGMSPAMGGMGGLGAPMNMMNPAMGGIGGAGVVLVDGLAPTVTADDLFPLFGVYGDVQRVKILYNKRDTAMVQYATGQQAAVAVQYLKQCPFFGGVLNVQKSKNTVCTLFLLHFIFFLKFVHIGLPDRQSTTQEIKLPRDQDAASSSLTKDFSNSPQHVAVNRFLGKNVGSVPGKTHAPSQVE